MEWTYCMKRRRITSKRDYGRENKRRRDKGKALKRSEKIFQK